MINPRGILSSEVNGQSGSGSTVVVISLHSSDCTTVRNVLSATALAVAVISGDVRAWTWPQIRSTARDSGLVFHLVTY